MCAQMDQVTKALFLKTSGIGFKSPHLLNSQFQLEILQAQTRSEKENFSFSGIQTGMLHYTMQLFIYKESNIWTALKFSMSTIRSRDGLSGKGTWFKTMRL